MSDDFAVHRIRALVRGDQPGTAARLVAISFPSGAGGPTVGDLARTLDLAPDDGLTVDKRRLAAGAPLTEAGLADGSLLECGPAPDLDPTRWAVAVLAGPASGSTWPVVGGVTTIADCPTADLRIPGVGSAVAVLTIAADGSAELVGDQGDVDLAPGEPFLVGRSVVAVTGRCAAVARPVSGVTIPVRPGIGPEPVAAPPPPEPPPGREGPPPPTMSVVGVIAPLAMGAAMAVWWSPRFALFAALGPVVAVGTWLEQRRRHRRAVRRHEVEDDERHASHTAAVEEHRAAESARARARLPDGPTAAQRARAGGRGLWDAPWPPLVPIGWDGTRPEGVPVVSRSLCVLGPAERTVGIARRMVVHLAVGHPPSRLAIDTTAWSDDDGRWAGWLPHLVDGRDRRSPERPTIHVMTGPPAHPPDESSGQIILLDVDDEPPPWADVHLLVGPDEQVLVRRGAVTGDAAVTARLMAATATMREAAATARHLARWRDMDAHATGDGAAVPLRRLTGDPGDRSRLETRWERSSVTTLAGVIGLDGDEPVEIDLVADGPHAVIGGTTGSGKSELLRTLVASMATRHPPDHVSFVLVDYKGGSAFDGCARLPHVATVVTDLDGSRTGRVLAGVDAELTRRERWLRGVERPDLAAASAADGRPPRLVVVIDEFATLVRDHAGALHSLVDVARRGRSLGVHLVLATQRPAGAMTDEIRANTALRIALRMVDPTDSSDVIGDPAAAHLPADRPGLAIVRRGGGAMQVVRVAITSGAVGPAHTLEVRPIPTPAAGFDASPPSDGPSELEVLSTAAAEVTETTGRRAAVPMWPPTLPTDLTPADLDGIVAPDRGATAVAIGVEDDLTRTTHVPFCWVLDDGVLVLHGARGADLAGVLTGIVTTGNRGQANPIHVHGLDGSGELAGWDRADVIGGLAGPGDRDGIRRIIERLERRLHERVGAPPATLLVVHDYGALGRDLDDLDGLRLLDRLNRVMAEGTAVAIHSILTTTRPGLVPPSVAGVAAATVVLRLGQRDDYRLVGIRPPTSPLPPGRGLLGHGHEVHLVRAEPAALETLCPCPESGRPHRLQPLPDSILLSELPAPAPTSDRWAVPIGLGFEGPVRLGVPSARPTVIAGPPGSGQSTALGTVLHQLAAGGATVVTVGGVGATLPLAGDEISVHELRDRIGTPPDPPVDRPLVVGVGDATEVVDVDDVLLDLVRGRWRTGDIRLVIAFDPSERRRAYNHWTSAVRRAGSGLALWPDPDDDRDLWTGPMPPAPTRTPPPGRGLLFTEGRPPDPVQVARP